MNTMLTNRQLWRNEFPIDGEWDAGATPPHFPLPKTGRWTARRDSDQFTVICHSYHTNTDTLLATFPPTEKGELDAKIFALSAKSNLQTVPAGEVLP
jgi:hypothetical protein